MAACTAIYNNQKLFQYGLYNDMWGKLLQSCLIMHFRYFHITKTFVH